MSATPDTVVTVKRERVTDSIGKTMRDTATYAFLWGSSWVAVTDATAEHFGSNGHTVARII